MTCQPRDNVEIFSPNPRQSYWWSQFRRPFIELTIRPLLFRVKAHRFLLTSEGIGIKNSVHRRKDRVNLSPKSPSDLACWDGCFHRFSMVLRALGSQMGELRALGIIELVRNP